MLLGPTMGTLRQWGPWAGPRPGTFRHATVPVEIRFLVAPGLVCIPGPTWGSLGRSHIGAPDVPFSLGSTGAGFFFAFTP